jgi:phage virion morphogenesis protein
MQIQINDAELQQKLKQAANHLKDTQPLMAGIANVLVSESLLNFQAQGRPKWAGLSPVTIAIYASRGRKRSSILQQSGMLRGSVQPSHTATTATIGAGSAASAKYAAIHQFGGMAGRGRKSKIPARPYLPMDKLGNLQRSAELEVLDEVEFFLGKTL